MGRPDFKFAKGPPAGPWWVRLPLSSATTPSAGVCRRWSLLRETAVSSRQSRQWNTTVLIGVLSHVESRWANGGSEIGIALFKGGPGFRCAQSGLRCSADCVYSITSSTRASSRRGTVMRRALAVLLLITSSNLVGSMTRDSAGVSPLRIRPA